MTRHSGTYAVVWPRSERTVAIRPLAPRLDALSGKRVAFIWDYVFRGDEIWGIAKQELATRFEGIEFVDHDTFGSTHGDNEQAVLAGLPERLKALKVDAVVSGMGC